jgi:hypothetical protein
VGVGSERYLIKAERKSDLLVYSVITLSYKLNKHSLLARDIIELTLTEKAIFKCSPENKLWV